MLKSFTALAVVTLAVSFAVATPVSAATVLLGGPSGNAASVIRSAEGVDFTFTAARFTGDPSLLSGLWSLGAPLPVSISSPGLGVAGGGAGNQIDTNQANRREALVVTASRPFEVSGLKLSAADANDTMMLYGVNEDGSFTPLVNGGTIRSGFDGAASVVNSSVNGRTSRLIFENPWGNFSQYVFTTRVPGNIFYNGDRGQGYRLDSISFNVIPEPRMWAMLIAGFGFVGVAARRRSSLSVID